MKRHNISHGGMLSAYQVICKWIYIYQRVLFVIVCFLSPNAAGKIDGSTERMCKSQCAIFLVPLLMSMSMSMAMK